MSKIVSQLDADGYFVGPVYADADRLVKNAYQILFGCIDLPPLSPEQIEPGMRYKPVDGKWIGEPIPEPASNPGLTPEEIAALEAIQRRTAVLSEITILEARQARPVREIIASIVSGVALPAVAVENLAALDSQIADLRKVL